MAHLCVLNRLDSSLGVRLTDGELMATPQSQGGFGYMWSGIRGVVGVCEGRYRFTVRLLRALPVSVPPQPGGPDSAAAAAVGVSFGDTDVDLLGEVPGSWSYSSSGSKQTGGCRPVPYGLPFGVGNEVRRVRLTAQRVHAGCTPGQGMLGDSGAPRHCT